MENIMHEQGALFFNQLMNTTDIQAQQSIMPSGEVTKTCLDGKSNNAYGSGFYQGLWAASYICEILAGDRKSRYAQKILEYATICELAQSLGKPPPAWRPC